MPARAPRSEWDQVFQRAQAEQRMQFQQPNRPVPPPVLHTYLLPGDTVRLRLHILRVALASTMRMEPLLWFPPLPAGHSAGKAYIPTASLHPWLPEGTADAR